MTKVEYIATFYWKDGRTNSITHSDYGKCLWDAATTFGFNKDAIDHYDITEVTTTTKLVKNVGILDTK